MNVILLFVLPLCLGVTGHQQRGTFNPLVVGKDRNIEDVKEIKSFSALFSEHGNDFSFILTLDGDVTLEHPDVAVVPTLFLLKDKKILASSHMRVSRSKEENQIVLQWSAVPDFYDESYCLIPTFPNRNNIMVLKVPFSSATVKRVTKDGKFHCATITTIKKSWHQKNTRARNSQIDFPYRYAKSCWPENEHATSFHIQCDARDSH